MSIPNPYLLTGCAGFIGARTAQLLLDEGHEVVGIDNMNDYYDVRLKEHRLNLLKEYGSFEFRQIDVEHTNDVLDLFAEYQFKTVLNLAARAGVRYSMVNPFIYMGTNGMGTLNLLEGMREHGGKKFVLASTSSLYAGQPMPFLESLPVNTPISPYASSKKSAEAMSFTYHHLYGIDVSILRYFTVYGPADRPDMAIHRFIQWIDKGVPIKLYGDGEQSRDFTFVDDIANGTIAATRPLGYEIINLGGGNNPITINSVIEKIENLLGKKAEINRLPMHKADMVSTWANIDKAGEKLGWGPGISLDEGLERCVNWYRENLPWSATIDLGAKN
ncbi:GDP-mannose 4,6-dehydratase [Mariniblastus fucicola]|uniref:UDP-glucose 4-epimerase n=1 Tax=Mariniblastus fucicola TaxID=980251 RepID=A0A5B9P6J9_9BACT|nr:GDP-mannose 4,6-dehydratase [Mariniblastus fucicola]QEG20286.1 UDP-glucose 4-epimerase [Mariniblastus fucicola]